MVLETTAVQEELRYALSEAVQHSCAARDVHFMHKRQPVLTFSLGHHLASIARCLKTCRYLATKYHDPHVADKSTAGTAARTATAKLQPASLAGNVLYTSPLSARSLSLSGRGKLADKGTVYTTKVCAGAAGCIQYHHVHAVCPLLCAQCAVSHQAAACSHLVESPSCRRLHVQHASLQAGKKNSPSCKLDICIVRTAAQCISHTTSGVKPVLQ